MNLTSCNNCGVVLDKSNLNFPWNYHTEEGIDEDKAMWNGDEWVACVKCPVCGNKIGEDE